MRRVTLFCLIILLLATSAGTSSTTTYAQDARELLRRYPVIPSIRGTIASQVRALVRLGKRQGNRLNVFSKVGDSITAWGLFLMPIGNGGLQLGSYTQLQRVVDYFMTSTARTGNPFVNDSLAARGGWTSTDLLDPSRADPSICQPGETPLACELRVVQPAVALIMIGTNDLPSLDVDLFRANIDLILRTVKDFGVVPVISTLPYRLDSAAAMTRIDTFNLAIVEVARTHAVPLWNYWLAMESLPTNGLSIDLVHPSGPPDNNTAIFLPDYLQYGFTVRNLTALQVLDRLLPYLR